ncbi:hypothetical protein [Lysobacter sp. A289]
MRSIEESPLEVYVDYTVLPANQAAVLLLSLENLYQLVASGRDKSAIRLPYRAEQIAQLGYPTDNESALSLESSNTGNSITFRFAGRRQPSRIRWDGSDLNFVLPRWSASAVAVGALVMGSMLTYDKWLDIQVKQLDVQQGALEMDRQHAEIEKLRAETSEIVRRLREPTQDDYYPERRRPDRHLDAISKNIQAFHSVASQPNIKVVKINGESLK